MDTRGSTGTMESLGTHGIHRYPWSLGGLPMSFGALPLTLGELPNGIRSTPNVIGSTPNLIGSTPHAIGSTPDHFLEQDDLQTLCYQNLESEYTITQNAKLGTSAACGTFLNCGVCVEVPAPSQHVAIGTKTMSLHLMLGGGAGPPAPSRGVREGSAHPAQHNGFH
jgi:hypothetical protein